MKTLILHAGLNAHAPSATARTVQDADQRDGYAVCSWHYIIDRAGVCTPCRPYKLPSVRENFPGIAREALSVLLIGGWSDKGPVSDFTFEQQRAVLELYEDLTFGNCVSGIVKVYSPVPTPKEVSEWLHL